jgi:hypothetical protein
MVTVMGVPAGIEVAACIGVARDKQRALRNRGKCVRTFISVTSKRSAAYTEDATLRLEHHFIYKW